MNLSQRLQDLARPEDRIVLSDATYQALTSPPANCEPLGEQLVKGRQTPVLAYLDRLLAVIVLRSEQLSGGNHGRIR